MIKTQAKIRENGQTNWNESSQLIWPLKSNWLKTYPERALSSALSTFEKKKENAMCDIINKQWNTVEIDKNCMLDNRHANNFWIFLKFVSNFLFSHWLMELKSSFKWTHLFQHSIHFLIFQLATIICVNFNLFPISSVPISLCVCGVWVSEK